MRAKFKNNNIIELFVIFFFLAGIGFGGIYYTLNKSDSQFVINLVYYLCSVILILVSTYKLLKLDIEMVISLDQIIFKEINFFFLRTHVIEKNEIELLKIKYNSLCGGRLNLILKNKKIISIHLDILEIEEGVLPDVELRPGIVPRTNLYYILATAKFISQEWNIPFQSHYLKES